MQRYIIWPLIKEEIVSNRSTRYQSITLSEKQKETKAAAINDFNWEDKDNLEKWMTRCGLSVSFPPYLGDRHSSFRSNSDHSPADLCLGGQRYCVLCRVANPGQILSLGVVFLLERLDGHRSPITLSALCTGRQFQNGQLPVNSGDIGQGKIWNWTTLLRVGHPTGHGKHHVLNT